jgi:hypothetical protein
MVGLVVFKESEVAPLSGSFPVTLDAHQTVDRLLLIKIIAERTRSRHDTSRTAEDRVRKWMAYATKCNRLVVRGHDQYVLGEVVQLARRRWGDMLDDLPELPVPAQPIKRLVGSMDLTYSITDMTAEESLATERATVQELQLRLQQARDEIERLSPYARRYVEILEKNRASGRMRKPRAR